MEPGHPSKPPATPIALVFTDMVGSSAAKRAASLGGDSGERDAAFLNAIQVRHFKLVRDCMRPHGGTEIMTMGDAFFLTFPDVRSAVLCAADIQRELKAQPIMTAIGPMQLRIGVHCGTPKFSDNSWHGKDVETAGRVEATAAAGQIILSEPAHQLMADTPEVRLHPLGTFSLAKIELPLWDVDYDGEGPRRPQVLSVEEKRRRHRRKLLWRGGIAGLVALLAVIGVLWFRYRQQNRLHPGDELVLATFYNKTGDAQFDGALDQAIAIQFEQSPMLRLANPAELRAYLHAAGQATDQPVTTKLACSMAGQTGLKAVVAGSISGPASGGYIVSLQAVQCRTGRTIGHAKEQAPDKDHVLSALARAASGLRVSLGESSDSVLRFSTPFASESGSALDALHVFGQAEAAAGRGPASQAISLYRQAIALDPGFALAYARIGSLEESAGHTAEALKDLSRAYDLRDHATERQRLGILALLARTRGNLPAAIAAYQQLLKSFPQDTGALESLGELYIEAGDPTRAAPFFGRAAAAAPWSGAAQEKLAAIELALGDTGKARQAMEASTRSAETEAPLRGRNRALYAFETGDPNWKSLLASGASSSDAAPGSGMSDLFYLTGQLTGARAAVEQEVAEAVRSGSSLTAGHLLASAALQEAVYGVCGRVPEMSSRALALDSSLHTLPSALLAQALCGQKPGGSAALDKLAQQFPENTRLTDIALPEYAAATALLAHRPAEVPNLLESTRPYRLASLSPNLEAEALLALHHPEEALTDLAPALRYPFYGVRWGLTGERPSYGMALLLAGRAHAAAGDTAAADESFRRAMELWQGADAGFPPLLQAQKERAALTTRKPLP